MFEPDFKLFAWTSHGLPTVCLLFASVACVSSDYIYNITSLGPRNDANSKTEWLPHTEQHDVSDERGLCAPIETRTRTRHCRRLIQTQMAAIAYSKTTANKAPTDSTSAPCRWVRTRKAVAARPCAAMHAATAG